MPSALSVFGLYSATRDENTSGREEPAAMSVAPMTSSDKWNLSPIAISDATK